MKRFYIVLFSHCGPILLSAKNLAEVVDLYPEAIGIILIPNEVY